MVIAFGDDADAVPGDQIGAPGHAAGQGVFDGHDRAPDAAGGETASNTSVSVGQGVSDAPAPTSASAASSLNAPGTP